MSCSRAQTKDPTPARRGAIDRYLRTLPARLCVLAALLIPICGCESYSTEDGMANAYYLDPDRSLHTLGRVALVELDNMSSYPNISAGVTEALYLAIQKKQLFGVQVVRQEDPAWRSLQESLDSSQTLRKLLAVRDTLQCDGLLLGTITQYQPYPHMVIAVRMKLLDLTDGRLLWGVEQVWDCADKSIQKRIEAYYRHERPSTSTSLREELVAVSHLDFARFVAYEIAETLRGDEK